MKVKWQELMEKQEDSERMRIVSTAKTVAVSDYQSYLETAQQVLLNEAAAIAEIAQNLEESFGRVIDLILQSTGRVIVTGMGKSGHIARKIAATFSSTGQPSLFVHPAEASHGDMGMITTQDVVIALSNSGETAELADIIEYTRRYQIPLVAITRGHQSTLARHADYKFFLPNSPEACPMNLAPTTSTTMMLAFGDALAVTLLKIRQFTPTDFKVFHPGGNLGEKLHKVRDKMHVGQSLPLVNVDDKMTDAIVLISSKGFGCAGVVDHQGLLVGVITDGDLRRHMQADMLTYRASQVMTAHPATIPAEMLMSEALSLMNQKKITSLFVVDKGVPLGLIHIHDFLRAGII